MADLRDLIAEALYNADVAMDLRRDLPPWSSDLGPVSRGYLGMADAVIAVLEAEVERLAARDADRSPHAAWFASLRALIDADSKTVVSGRHFTEDAS